MKIGERVGAIQSANEQTVKLYGYGEYLGETIPPKGILNDMSITNPTIRLDSGELVYGFECWWGAEEKVKEMIKGRKIEIVKIEGKAI